jgi:hypothetical protein
MSARGRRARGRPLSSGVSAPNFSGRKTMKFAALCTTFLLTLAAQTAFGQDKPYKEGSVWTVTFVKVKPGMMDTYLRDLGANRKKLMEQAKKDGLILSERLLSGDATGREDYDLILMVEFKNWGAFDGLSDKFRALAEKMVGSEDKQVQMMTKRTEVREILGTKTMQEIFLR